MPAGYKGHRRRPNKDHLIELSALRHGHKLRNMMAVMAPPDNWDSVALGWIPPIKDQGQCGSCWDFSGTGVCEIAYWKVGQQIILSEEYTLSCGQNGGCNGDDNTTVLDWAKKTGIPLTSDYGPYDASAGRCAWKQGMALYKIDDWGFADPNAQGQTVASTQSIQAAIMQYGCVGCAVAAGGSSFWDSGTGEDTGNSNSIDHDVIIVGWRPAGSSRLMATLDPALPPARVNLVDWKMRNSWGTSWGNSGYGWVREGADSIGTEAVWAVIHSNPPPIDFF